MRIPKQEDWTRNCVNGCTTASASCIRNKQIRVRWLAVGSEAVQDCQAHTQKLQRAPDLESWSSNIFQRPKSRALPVLCDRFPSEAKNPTLLHPGLLQSCRGSLKPTLNPGTRNPKPQTSPSCSSREPPSSAARGRSSVAQGAPDEADSLEHGSLNQEYIRKINSMLMLLLSSTM